MICDDLALTGTDFAWPALILAALGLLAIGLVLVLVRRRRARALGLLVLVTCLVGVFLVAGATLVPAPPASAAEPCPSPSPSASNSLTITQTSTNAGLAPLLAPSAIAGRVVNNGPDETFVTAIVVSIDSVVKAPGAAAGICDASDYVLIDPRMPVGEQLAANGGSTTFDGAHIGFLDKLSNQDACKGATVGLLYVTD